MTEIDDMRRGMLALSKAGAVVFRHNVAQGVVGRVTWFRKPERVAVGPGDCVVRGARVLHAGLVKGGSDILGWTSITITPEMVGQRVAVFTAVEWKAEDGVIDPDQQTFVDNVTRAGGFAGFARCISDALAIVVWKNK